MIRIDNKRINGREVIYDYRVWDKGQKGAIKVNMDNGSYKIVRIAEDNPRPTHYANKALGLVLKLNKNKEYPNSKVIAWE